MHFHLVNVTIRKRMQWAFNSSGNPVLPLTTIPGTARPADPNERGWKETVRMNPGEVTRVIMQLKLPQLPTKAMRNAVSPRTGGHEYVHHCHILEHEEHDMMRPLIVF
jgi:spore coat protein A